MHSQMSILVREPGKDLSLSTQPFRLFIFDKNLVLKDRIDAMCCVLNTYWPFLYIVLSPEGTQSGNCVVHDDVKDKVVNCKKGTHHSSKICEKPMHRVKIPKRPCNMCWGA